MPDHSALLSIGFRWAGFAGVETTNPVVGYVTLFIGAQAIVLMALYLQLVIRIPFKRWAFARRERISRIYEAEIFDRMLGQDSPPFRSPIPSRRKLYRELLLRQIDMLQGTERKRLELAYAECGFLRVHQKELRDLRWWVRLRAVVSLDRLRSEATAVLLRPVMKDARPMVAAEAIQAMARIGVADDLREALELLKSARFQKRPSAVQEILHTLADREPEMLLGWLETLSGTHPGSPLFTIAVKVLGEKQVNAAAPVLLPRLRDSDLPVSALSEIIETLGKLGDPTALEAVRAYLNDLNPDIRARTVVSLVRLGGKKEIESILVLRQDSDLRVQRAIKAVMDARWTL